MTEVLTGIHAVKIAKYVAAGICMAFGGTGTALGQGFIGGKSCESIGKSPENASLIIRHSLLSMMLVETTAIFAFIVSLILLFFV